MIKKVVAGLCLLIIVLALVAQIYGRFDVHGRVTQDAHTWFVALKRNAQANATLGVADDVNLRWQSSALTVLVGEAPPYWTDFAVLGSADDVALPIVLDSRYQDAYVVKLEKDSLPNIVAGTFLLLQKIGVLSASEQALAKDMNESVFRPGIGPSPESVQALLAQPEGYQPAMVNFLSYHDVARYTPSTVNVSAETTVEQDNTGKAAYLRYGTIAIRSAYSIGAKLIINGTIGKVVLPASHGASASGDNTPWDSIAIMQYPSPSAILNLGSYDGYREALIHRNAGLARTRVVSSLPVMLSNDGR